MTPPKPLDGFCIGTQRSKGVIGYPCTYCALCRSNDSRGLFRMPICDSSDVIEVNPKVWLTHSVTYSTYRLNWFGWVSRPSSLIGRLYLQYLLYGQLGSLDSLQPFSKHRFLTFLITPHLSNIFLVHEDLNSITKSLNVYILPRTPRKEWIVRNPLSVCDFRSSSSDQ